MPITVWSLNGGRFIGRTPDEEPQSLKWLKGLSEPGAIIPDVLCLQDFRASLIPYLRPLPHFHLAAMTHHKVWGKRELWGICIASRYPLNDIAIHYTWGDGIVRDIEGVGENSKRIDPTPAGDELVLKNENWGAVACTVLKPGELPFRIATHHGFWTRDGVPTEKQMQSTDSLCSFLAEQGRKHGGIVYAADCNPDKEGNVLRKYSESGGRDCLSPHIKTTLADHHPAAKLGIKADHIMQWPDEHGRFMYDISDVSVDPSPGSDHLMLCSTVSKHP